MATTPTPLRAALNSHASSHKGKAGCVSTTVYVPKWLHDFVVRDTEANSRGAVSNTVVHALKQYAESHGVTEPVAPAVPDAEQTSRDVLALAARDQNAAMQLLGKLAAALTGGGDGALCFAW